MIERHARLTRTAVHQGGINVAKVRLPSIKRKRQYKYCLIPYKLTGSRSWVAYDYGSTRNTLKMGIIQWYHLKLTLEFIPRMNGARSSRVIDLIMSR